MKQSRSIAIETNHPAYAGHFPGQPILPGVVLLDAMVHSLAALQDIAASGIQIKSAKFLSPVRPGETITLDYELTAAGPYRFEIMANGRRAASGVVEFTRPDAET
jgi:3-hydroxymyristoyl/3-hydroxydecanoyl-(acyl carrier protein) dehydratase